MDLIIRHYLKSAWVNFKHKKWYISLMVVSLAIGMFCFIISSLYVDFEYNRNSNHTNADRVYRLLLKMNEEGRNTYFPNPFSMEIANRHPDIEAVSLLDGTQQELYLTVNGEEYITEESGYYADHGFFDVFTFPLKYGDEDTAFDDVNSVVISERLAKLFFNDENPLGKELTVHDKGSFLVTGVLEKVSSRSLMRPEILFSRELLYKEDDRRKKGPVLFTHVKVSESTDIQALEENLFLSYRELYPDIDRFVGVFSERLDQAYWGNSYYDYSDGAQYPSFFGADKRMINIVGYTSFGVMICAIIGFLSLSLGLSLKRAKEIGVRKVNGASKKNIQLQVLSESVCYAYLALILTLIGLEITSNYFANLFGVPIGLTYSDLTLVFKLLAFTTVMGLIAGAYPAIIMSRLNPVKVLFGFNSNHGAGFSVNRALLIIQFVATIILVFGTLVQSNQVEKLLAFDFGYDKENIIAFTFNRKTNHRENITQISERLQAIEGVEELSGGPFPYNFNGYYKLKYDNGDTLITTDVPLVSVRENFFDMLDINMVEGKSFEPYSELNNEFVINRAMANQLGEGVINQLLEFAGRTGKVIGVAEDYTDWGLTQPNADPRIFEVDNGSKFHSILIKHNGKNTVQLIEELETEWRSYESVLSPQITILADEVDDLTTRVEKSAKLSGFLSSMVMVLSFLNLFGYAVMYGRSKIRNISIRKILGAESIELFLRLTKPFLGALSISILVAMPLAYWLMELYLSDYAVRIELGVSEGLMVTLVMFFSLLLVVSFQMLNVSRMNPTKVLKEE